MAKLTFESAMQRLEEIAAMLEEGTETLESSLKLFEESNELVSFCMKKLDEAEAKIQLLSKNGEGFRVQDVELD